MTFTHFFVDGDRTHLFSIEECENCSTTTQAVNAMTGLASEVPKYLSVGMKEMKTLPPEQYYSDDLGGCACESCNG